jgi:hypothetical protein
VDLRSSRSGRFLTHNYNSVPNPEIPGLISDVGDYLTGPFYNVMGVNSKELTPSLVF